MTQDDKTPDTEVQHLLGLSHQYLEGKIPKAVLEAQANKAAQDTHTETKELPTQLQRINAHTEDTLVPRKVTYDPHTYAYLAAIEVMFRMLPGYRATWDKIKLQEDHTDAVLNSRNSDTAFYAVSAYARGPVWVESSSDQKRLEFWRWWLDEAIPQAWLMSIT